MNERYKQILKNDNYIQIINKIENKEEDRIYCKHDLTHFLDVARIAYIISLEKNLNINKDLIYAAALFHDAGRVRADKDHDKTGAVIAEPILRECGYCEEEIKDIKSAIQGHREKKKGLNTLEELISYADMVSRQCYNCSAKESCYWSNDKKNTTAYY
ncbi:MAG: HD domain-containing protein [Firmicutes bacterium]|nr:HD domain-containing protein [Bacillota bacterium]